MRYAACIIDLRDACAFADFPAFITKRRESRWCLEARDEQVALCWAETAHHKVCFGCRPVTSCLKLLMQLRQLIGLQMHKLFFPEDERHVYAI